MTSFLLIISFLLHIVAFVAIYQLYKQTQRPKEENASKDIMELFDMYLTEVKEENKRLEKTLLDIEQYKSAEKINKKTETKEVDHTYTLPDVGDDIHFETSLQAKVLQMYDQGMSNPEIARELNCGNTEVDLIVKLHAKD